MNEFTETEVNVMKRALIYWLKRWDWESELLFGIGHTEFRSLSEIGNFESENAAVLERLALAAHGSLREILHGACSVPRNQAKEILGIETSEANGLQSRLSKYGV